MLAPYLRWLLLTVGACMALLAQQPEGPSVTAVRHWSNQGSTRVAIELTGTAEYRHERITGPERLFFDIKAAKALGGRKQATLPVADSIIKQVRVAATQVGVTRVVLDLQGETDYAISTLERPFRIIVELRPKGSMPVTVSRTAPEPKPLEPKLPEPKALEPKQPAPKLAELKLPVTKATVPPPAEQPKTEQPKVVEQLKQPEMTTAETRRPSPFLPPPVVRPVESAPEPAESRKPEPRLVAATKPVTRSAGKAAEREVEMAVAARSTTSTGDRTLARVLGLKLGRIVLDPGHGGHDTGANGFGGLTEKELVLDVAKRLKDLIVDRMGSEVVLTREDDTFIPLEERTQIANKAHADLFLSIHANSSRSRSATGMETFYLNFTTDQDSLDVAARENATSGRGVGELRDLLQKIALNDKVNESRELAAHVQNSMQGHFVKAVAKNGRNRGVKKAPFVVLIGAAMPAVLAEIGFISNAKEESLMQKPEYRQKLAEALYRGLTAYGNTLARFQTAEKESAKSQLAAR